ncbi:MAG: hypothetical protein HYS21_00095 [Deltaproteobacteria bacterium]|nr:hypothetical protein [Deltaproteobacteria bacterium]
MDRRVIEIDLAGEEDVVIVSAKGTDCGCNCTKCTCGGKKGAYEEDRLVELNCGETLLIMPEATLELWDKWFLSKQAI